MIRVYCDGLCEPVNSEYVTASRLKRGRLAGRA